ncbi:hypothetical protein B7494_g6839 [Chlorociboria aeruginascens]|nr:hypothetical protein B7494_g6839 [Chlorociboria aeruginascens]
MIPSYHHLPSDSAQSPSHTKPQSPSMKSRGSASGSKSGKIKRSTSSPNVSGQATADAAALALSAEKRRNKLGYHRTSVACGHCRRRKIRCIPAQGDSQNRCSNCIRLKKECNFYPVDQQPQPESRRKDSKAPSGSGIASESSSPSTTSGQLPEMQPTLPYPHLSMPPIQDLGGPNIKRQRTESFSPENKGVPPRNYEYNQGPTNWMAPNASPSTKTQAELPSSYWRVGPQDSPLTPAFSPFTPSLQIPPPQNWPSHPSEPSSREDLSWSGPQRSFSYSNLEGVQNHHSYAPYAHPPPPHPSNDHYKSRMEHPGMYPPPISTSAPSLPPAETSSASTPSWQSPYPYPKPAGTSAEGYGSYGASPHLSDEGNPVSGHGPPYPLVEIRAAQRTFEGAYIRTALGQFSFALVVLKIFTSEFYSIGALFATYGAGVLLVIIVIALFSNGTKKRYDLRAIPEKTYHEFPDGYYNESSTYIRRQHSRFQDGAQFAYAQRRRKYNYTSNASIKNVYVIWEPLSTPHADLDRLAGREADGVGVERLPPYTPCRSHREGCASTCWGTSVRSSPPGDRKAQDHVRDCGGREPTQPQTTSSPVVARRREIPSTASLPCLATGRLTSCQSVEHLLLSSLLQRRRLLRLRQPVMSSHITTSITAVDDQVHPRDLADGLGLNTAHLPTTPLDNTLLSPFNYSNTISNSASPYHLGSTPGESLSEYSNYQPSDYSEIEDEFFGVDFDAGVQRTDSLPSNILGQTKYHLPEVSRHVNLEQSLEILSNSTCPLSPEPTISNNPSPRAEINDSKARATISPIELTSDFHCSKIQTTFPGTRSNLRELLLTPDHSGSSHTSAEGLGPSTMARLDQSPRVTIEQWGHGRPGISSNPYVQSRDNYINESDTRFHEGHFEGQGMVQTPQDIVLRDDYGQWKPNDTTGQSGLDPQSRKSIADREVTSLKQQERDRQVEQKKTEVREWRECLPADDERPDQSYFPRNSEIWSSERRRTLPADEDSNVAPVDDAASIRENRLVEGQVYYKMKNESAPLSDADIAIMSQPRQFNDAPSLPHIMATTFQPKSSEDAINQWNANADTFSLLSRAATWGTRRRSEPSLKDYMAVEDGNFLKKLSISKPKEETRPRTNSIFDRGLDGLANMVRKKSDAKLKRSRSTHNVPEEAENPQQPRVSNLAPPPRTSSFGRKATPNINTAFAAMTGPLAAVGTTHARSGSVSGTATSPKSPIQHLGFARSVLKRARSKSELSTQDNNGQGNLVGLWRGQGGPPVPNLASPPVENDTKQPENIDQDGSDDEDDEQGDEGDLKMEIPQQLDPIIPTYEGFKSHVRRLNPDMDKTYQWLVNRIAHQQEIRYKNLLDLRVKHAQAIQDRNCSAGSHCVSMGGSATLFDAKGKPREVDRGLQLMTDFSDDSNPGEGALTEETFPQGVPMPPTRNLPAEFECQLCFKAKKFQKPSDWTKHVHEDVQPFTCTYDKCKEPKSFKRKADWVRHENERHRHLEWWICQVDDCRHPCFRKDNFLQHLVREHKLPEPKQKTKAAIKKARHTERVWIMLEQCHHETQNKPQDEPCKFCGKSFATWKKLTVHLAKHMEHISLPVLGLVETRNVDADTIISPVEQIVTPITPGAKTKFESSSPFNMDAISPHAPVGQQFPSTFEPPGFFSSTGPSPTYGIHSQIPQGLPFSQTQMYPSAFAAQPIDQAHAFNSLDSSGVTHMNHSRAFGSVDSSFSHTKVDTTPGFESVDSSYIQSMPQQYAHPLSGYSMAQSFSSGPPAVSGYQTQNMLSISDVDYDFDPMIVNNTPNFQTNLIDDSFKEVIMRVILSHFFGPRPTENIHLIVGSSVATTLAVVAIARLVFRSTPQKIVRSPRYTLLPSLLPYEQHELPYPPDAFPGARDVESPYGSIRVYEWGPEKGRKVLLVHGISTPCIALGGIANGLVDKGCRVMLLDLFGRGYSDSPDLPHDSRLYTTQILIAITSSPLAWTPEGFSVVGYSLGGGIVVDFAASFPAMVKSVVLLAPGGLIRRHHFSWRNIILYSGWIPERLMLFLARLRLQTPVKEIDAKSPEGAVVGEIKGTDTATPVLSKNRPGVNVNAVVQWQVENHLGFTRSFVSSTRYASISGSHETWKKLGSRQDKVLVLAGSTDPFIILSEFKPDVTECFGASKLEWKEIAAGHEFPVTHAADVVREVIEHWGLD